MGKDIKRTIIISAVNFRSGGPLSILKDCISYLAKNKLDSFRVIVLAHNKNIFSVTSEIEIIEFPKSIDSYLYRIYLEYFFFKTISKKERPYLWLSLHDITPNVDATIRAVYCHNPAPFYKAKAIEFLLEPTFLLFNKIYSLFYRANINKNNYIIVQQQWLRALFKEKFTSKPIIVSYPNVTLLSKNEESPAISKKTEYIFFYPTLPRVFKNIEIIIEATKIVNINSRFSFDVIITINGSENKYAKSIVDACKNIKNIKFIGRVSREEVFNHYSNADCLIFPSKLETWGLPITEFKNTGKAMLVADLPYAHETVGTYRNVSFFDPNSPQILAALMLDAINGTLQQQGSIATIPSEPFAENWGELFDILLAEKDSKLE